MGRPRLVVAVDVAHPDAEEVEAVAAADAVGVVVEDAAASNLALTIPWAIRPTP